MPGKRKVGAVEAWMVFRPTGEPVIWSANYFRGLAWGEATRYCMSATDFHRMTPAQRRKHIQNRGFYSGRIRITPIKHKPRRTK